MTALTGSVITATALTGWVDAATALTGGVGNPLYNKMVKKSFGSMVALWPLTETSGTVANDVSGNARHGAYVSSPALAAATINRWPAPTFSGDARYVNLYSASLNTAFPRSAGTMFFWGANTAWVSAAGTRNVIRLYTDGNNQIRIYKSISGTFVLQRIAQAVTHTTTVTMSSASPWSAAIAYDTSTPRIAIFINGAVVYQSALNVLAHVGNLSSAITYIAKLDAGYSWIGSVNFVGLWNVALSDADILDLATA